MDLDGIRRRLRPTTAEAEAFAADQQALLAATREAMEQAGLDGAPSIQGSAAKGTWIAGQADLDLFLLLDPATPEARLKEAAEQVAAVVLEDPQKKYAQHPYVVGRFRQREVDLVPAYAVAAASDRMSAVDRTPFHTAWVAGRLDDRLRDEVRLAKQWLKGIGVYGAETAIGGFSGYLVEVLVLRFDGFGAFVDWLAKDAVPRRIAWDEDHVDEDAPLVVVDPVDPSRNCAAAVQEPVLQAAVEAARAFQDRPSEAFFFPAPPRAEGSTDLRAALKDQDEQWIGIHLRPKTDRLDIVLPQFQRAARQVAEGFERAGFHVHRWSVDPFDGHVGLQWVLADEELPATRRHEGPPEDSPHADRFRAKWQDHPDRVGPFTVDDGRLAVTVRNRWRDPRSWISAQGLRFLTGKHVQAAMSARPPLLGGPGLADEAWAPRVADVVLDRRPWER